MFLGLFCELYLHPYDRRMSGKVSGRCIPLRSNNPIKGSSRLELHSVGGLCGLYFSLRNDWLHSNASSTETVNVNMQRLRWQTRSETHGSVDVNGVVCVAKVDLHVCWCALSCRNARSV